MAIQIFREITLGDMNARYLTDEDKHIGLVLLPAQLSVPEGLEKREIIDSFVQLHFAGDIYSEAYAMGNSMRNGETVRRLKLESQTIDETDGNIIVRTVMDGEGAYKVVHLLKWKRGTRYLRITTELQNTGDKALRVEMLESFSLSGISPYLNGDGHEQMQLHRIRSVWSQEGRLETIPLEDMQLEPAWGPQAVRCEKYGQIGSMPVNKFFPFAAIEDCKNNVFWGAQIAHNASWQMEIYRKDEAVCMSGGLADRDFGHWMKNIEPGEKFLTPEAIVSVAHTDSLDEFTGRLTEAAQEGIERAPESERDLPIIFNEYCTTWGNPSHENIMGILEAIKDKGFRYFMIDCGWYKENGVPWDISMGDYEPSKELFPEGLEKTVAAIKDAGMIPGIWFEIENVGSAAKAYQLEEHLLHKDGHVLTSYFRRFWNLTDPWVQDYLSKKVIGTLQKYGFGYMKIDYNETIGVGCDGAESLGEGLRQNMEASKEFIEKIKDEVPGIVLENCASGGHRLEPGLMSQMSMASFSDAHECREIPIIAANLHRVIHPAQSQIWAVIRETDSLQRIAYSVVNTFLGRMCISGDVTHLTDAQWKVIDDGMDFYRKLVPVILHGQSYRFGPKVKSDRNPEGWQAMVRVGENGQAYVTVHMFGGELPEKIEITLPKSAPGNIAQVYSCEENEDVTITDGVLTYKNLKNDKAIALLLV